MESGLLNILFSIGGLCQLFADMLSIAWGCRFTIRQGRILFSCIFTHICHFAVEIDMLADIG